MASLTNVSAMMPANHFHHHYQHHDRSQHHQEQQEHHKLTNMLIIIITIVVITITCSSRIVSGASPYETGSLQALQVDRVSQGSSFPGAWRSRRTETSGPRCLPVFIIIMEKKLVMVSRMILTMIMSTMMMMTTSIQNFS